MFRHKEAPAVETEAGCRREAERIPLPIEVEVYFEEIVVRGVVRDVTADDVSLLHGSGLALFHHDPLPIGQPVTLHTLSDTELLPPICELVLIWSRHFEEDGYLSGGVLHERH